MEVKRSLNWNAKDVPDFDRKQQENPAILNCLIWSSLSIGMGEITEDNLAEWVYRLRRFAFEEHPLIIRRDGTPYEITEETIRPWIGLRTNVSPITNAAFDAIMRKRTGR